MEQSLHHAEYVGNGRKYSNTVVFIVSEAAWLFMVHETGNVPESAAPPRAIEKICDGCVYTFVRLLCVRVPRLWAFVRSNRSTFLRVKIHVKETVAAASLPASCRWWATKDSEQAFYFFSLLVCR